MKILIISQINVIFKIGNGIMKKISIIFTIFIFAIVLIGYLPKSSIYISILDKVETYPAAPGELEVVYENFEDIVYDAEVIVNISVRNQKVELLDGYPQTHTFVNVQEVYKGNVASGDIIEREGYLFQQATEDTKLKNYKPLSEVSFSTSLERLTVIVDEQGK